ncbi:MAG: plasmid pRiA4b ORF-3 family protein [Spirochaetales bacterium]|jgi:hypothetical protein|nr:plasmid pRiA4b ORF-3 family protein [Spirochaetales bacterium]
MTKKTQLKKRVEDFILSQSTDFRFADIAENPAVSSAGGFSEKALLDILETNGLVFSKDFNVFKPRHLFFQNARFIVSPTEEEVKNRFLIPGHRFIPFCSSTTQPWKCILLTSSSGEGEGNPLAKKTIQKKLSSLDIYYVLFGQENFSYSLIQDQPSNEQIFRNDSPGLEHMNVTITAFDFTALFKEWNFSFGDGLLLQVKDWTRGIFSMEYLPLRRRHELMKTSADWIAKLEKGFLKSFDDLGLAFSLEEQVAYAYYYAGASVLKEPPLHLGGFIDSSPRVNFVAFGMETRLWRETRIEVSDLGYPGQAAPTGATGSLDAIFEDLGVALTETEVQAYMRDELFQRRENPDAVLERIFADRFIPFFSEEQMNDFVRYFKKLWNRVKRNYNYFADQLAGKARSSILLILDNHYTWMKNLEIREMRDSDLPAQEISSLSQVTEFLLENLDLLNRKSAGREEEIRKSIDLLPQVEEFLDDLHQEITEKLEELPQRNDASTPEERRQGLYLVKPDSPGKVPADTGSLPGSAYILRITLLDIKPAIWRDFQIPGQLSLAALHTVIQDVMGWEDYHAHSFQVGGKLYGPILEESFGLGLDQINEADVTVGELGLKEKQKFQYTYDFGDNWLHQITVMKILPTTAAVLCLGGKRACPPEDCGGIPGYEDILEALASSNKKKNRELLSWLGEYDPEAFDIDAINEILEGHT